MGRKPTGNPPGRPKKKPTGSSSNLCWELENVPHQSDLHHLLYAIAGAFEAGPNWFESVELPLREILGDKLAERIKAAKWEKDGADFYALMERWIQRTAFDQTLGSEAAFLSSVLKNCAHGFVAKYKTLINKNDVGEIVGRAFEKIAVSGKYDPSDSKARKLSYLKVTTYSAGYELLRERMPGKRKKQPEKVLTAREKKSSQVPLRQFTFEDFLVELDMVIGPAKTKKAA